MTRTDSIKAQLELILKKPDFCV